MLGKYLTDDLADGTVTLDQAREILAHFFIKGCEWITSTQPGRYHGGDGQHYQNIVLAGIDENGDEVCNEVTYLVLDIIEELGIGDFPVSVRLNAHTPARLLRRCAEVVRHGGGIVDALDVLLTDTLGLKDETQIEPKDEKQKASKLITFSSYEELYKSFKQNLTNRVEALYSDAIVDRTGQVPGRDWNWSPANPCSVISLFTENCAESDRSYFDGGAKYTVISPHIGGAPDTGNSLYAIKKLVFDEKKIGLEELIRTLTAMKALDSTL
jgi:formate C-acetyltransferase